MGGHSGNFGRLGNFGQFWALFGKLGKLVQSGQKSGSFPIRFFSVSAEIQFGFFGLRTWSEIGTEKELARQKKISKKRAKFFFEKAKKWPGFLALRPTLEEILGKEHWQLLLNILSKELIEQLT